VTNLPDQPSPVRDWGVSWLRTVVPTAWGAMLTFLLSRFPDVHEALSTPAVTMAVTAAVVAAWYTLFRWLEPKIPAWLTALLMGSNSTPHYGPVVEGEVASVRDVPYRR
jgi:hypothetical protein